MTDFGDFNIELDYNTIQVGDAEKAQNQPQSSISKQSQPQIANSYGSSNNNDQLNVNSSDYNLSNAAHPIACIATVSFKALAIFLYFISFYRL